jgi:glyoxalase family protein
VNFQLLFCIYIEKDELIISIYGQFSAGKLEYKMRGVINGIHHVTAIAGDPQRNIDFYTDVLGIKLVKLTVNFDDPGTYHFYYADVRGTPGTILTFFPWPGGPPGRRGMGQATSLAFSVPLNAINYWKDRLQRRSVIQTAVSRRYNEEVLTFYDPDNLCVELIASNSAMLDGIKGPIPDDYAIRGIHSVTLTESPRAQTKRFLEENLGFTTLGVEHERTRMISGDGPLGNAVDIVPDKSGKLGYVSVGTIHHVAFRIVGKDSQIMLKDKIVEAGHQVTPIRDRKYFQSIYFREPGGVLLEVATESPGFMIDEPYSSLGRHLMLPESLENRRIEIERSLPRISLPKWSVAA